MATPLEANLGILAALASLGFGVLLAVLGLMSARRLDSAKLAWVSVGFLLLALQGAVFAWRIRSDPLGADSAVLPAVLGLLAMIVLYGAVYRRR